MVELEGRIGKTAYEKFLGVGSKAALALKEKIKNKELNFGIQLYTPCPDTAEVIGLAGFDWLWICIEHGPLGYGTELENIVRACNVVGMVPFCRITEPTDHFLYMKTMECGVKGIIVPRVRGKEDVEFAVKAVKWAKGKYNGNHGGCHYSRRWGYAGDTPDDYLKRDEAETFVVIMLETAEAIEDLEGILSVPGIDFVRLGTGDLMREMGFRGRGQKQVYEYEEEKLVSIRNKVRESCKRHNVPLCEHWPNTSEGVRKLVEEQGEFIFAAGPDWRYSYAMFKNMTDETRSVFDSVKAKKAKK